MAVGCPTWDGIILYIIVGPVIYLLRQNISPGVTETVHDGRYERKQTKQLGFIKDKHKLSFICVW